MEKYGVDAAKGNMPKRSYAKPALKVYGDVSSLTAGGTGGPNEAMVGGMNLSKSKI